MEQALGDCNFPAVCLGYGPSTAIHLYWDPTRDLYSRCHHRQVDDFNVLLKDAVAQSIIDKFVHHKISSLPSLSSALDYNPSLSHIIVSLIWSQFPLWVLWVLHGKVIMILAFCSLFA